MPILENEGELIARLKRGDLQAQEQVWRDHHANIHRYLVYATRGSSLRDGNGRHPSSGDYSDADDVMEDTFVDFFNGIQKFRGECSIRTYLVRVAEHNAKDFYRKHGRAHPMKYNPPLRSKLTHPSDGDYFLAADQVDPTVSDDFDDADGNGMGTDSSAASQKSRVRRFHAGDVVEHWGALPVGRSSIDLEEELKGISDSHRRVIVLRLALGMNTAETAQAMEISDGAVKMLLSRALKSLRQMSGPSLRPKKGVS
jgi:DNA-directed RNA polymerase specialized sigma24 family protein